MRREAITLVTAMALSTILMAACDKPRAPETGNSGAGSSTPPASPSTTTSQPPAPATPSASERKDGQPPIQGQVDPKSPPQERDFQRK